MEKFEAAKWLGNHCQKSVTHCAVFFCLIEASCAGRTDKDDREAGLEVVVRAQSWAAASVYLDWPTYY